MVRVSAAAPAVAGWEPHVSHYTGLQGTGIGITITEPISLELETIYMMVKITSGSSDAILLRFMRGAWCMAEACIDYALTVGKDYFITFSTTDTVGMISESRIMMPLPRVFLQQDDQLIITTPGGSAYLYINELTIISRKWT